MHNIKINMLTELLEDIIYDISEEEKDPETNQFYAKLIDLHDYIIESL